MTRKEHIIELIAKVLKREHGLSDWDFEFCLSDGEAIYRKLKKMGYLDGTK